MPEIKVLKQKDIAEGWEVEVKIGGLDFMVSVDREYWQELTGGKEAVEELVRRSFEFLLARESKESILRRFHLKDIEHYFPNYKEEIKL